MKSYIELMRPANLVTAVADILAGMALIGFFSNEFAYSSVLYLCVATLGLYGGGVVFNDVFDAELDAKERPERAIPSGRVPIQNAVILAVVLLITGILFAFLVNPVSGIVACLIALLALIYDKYAKHHSFFGPVTMGLCRSGNLILGMTALPTIWLQWAWLGMAPLIYIAAITLVSQGEVHGGKPKSLYLAAFCYILVSAFQLIIAFNNGSLPFTLLFVLQHLHLILKPLFAAMGNPVGALVGKAVKAGVLALIVMDAAWVAASGNLLLAILVVLLLPLSIWLAKYFAVT